MRFIQDLQMYVVHFASKLTRLCFQNIFDLIHTKINMISTIKHL